MNILIDVITLLIIVGTLIYGYKRGFIIVFMRFLALFAALIIASVLSGFLAEFVFENYVGPGIENKLDEQTAGLPGVGKLLDAESLNSLSVMRTIEELSASIKSHPLLSGFDLSAPEVTNKIEEDLTDRRSLKDMIMISVVKPMVIPALRTISFLAVFIIVRIVFGILIRNVKFINKIPIIGIADSLLGAVIGLLKGIIFAILLYFILHLFVVVSGNSSEYINENVLKQTLISKYAVRPRIMNIEM